MKESYFYSKAGLFALLQRVHVSLSHLDNIDFWLDFVVQMGKSPIGIVLFADFLVI